MTTPTTPALTPRKPVAPELDVHAPVYPPPVGARNPGITIHDWLAALAMQGLLMHGMKVTADRALSDDEKDDQLAERAYRVAGSMMRARAKALKDVS